MNLHVVLVHFPVAILSIYAVLELVRWRKLTALPYWFYLKAFLAIAGEAAALAAVLTGEIIEPRFRQSPEMMPLIEVHSRLGIATAAVFGVCALLYLLAWIGRAFPGYSGQNGLMKMSAAAERWIGSWAMPVLAFFGLILVTATGALGGAIVFGANVDPIASFAYRLLVPR